MEPVGILKAWKAKVRMNSARITATTMDSKYSRTTLFLPSKASGSASFLALIERRIVAETGDPVERQPQTGVGFSRVLFNASSALIR